MKTFLATIFAVGTIVCNGSAATTIDPVHPFACGANLGWINWRGDTTHGAAIGQFFCAGYLWAANAGWINLGSGVPANGVRYANLTGSDFGVNVDPLGHLRGRAWSPNLGWLNFDNKGDPKVDLLTGRLSGFAWSANTGWISLSNAVAHVRTGTLPGGPDTDGDGLPDAWELAHFGNLATAHAASDSDGDGLLDAHEYQADTNPLDPEDGLRIVAIRYEAATGEVALTWTSRPTRLYRIEQRSDANDGTPWEDSGLGWLAPGPETTITRIAPGSTAPMRIFRIQTVRPLSP